MDVLQKTGEIVRADEGGYSRLYPNGTSDSDKAIFSALNKSTDRRIVSCLVGTSTISHRELCSRTDLAKSTVSEHVSKLIETGVVKAYSSAENYLEYQLTDPDRVKILIKSRNPTMLRNATDRFIDLWDF